MDNINLFDAHAYFKGLCAKNKLAVANNFYPCSCSGIDTLEDVVTNIRTKSAFCCVDDTNDAVVEQINGGYFNHRVFTVFLLKRCKLNDMESRQKSLDICRQLFRQFHSRMIIDKNGLNDELIYLNTDRIPSREIGKYFMNGCTGLYFMVDIQEPTELIYNKDEWNR
jgi:hypothetical protein